MDIAIYKHSEKSLEEIKKQKHPFEDDLLNRKEIADNLVQIIINTKSPFVFNINSPYGTGKTFFLTRLKVLLEQRNCAAVLYNSWETDWEENPFIAILQEIEEEINCLVQSKKSFMNKAVKKAWKYVNAALKGLIPELTRHYIPGTAGIIDAINSTIKHLHKNTDPYIERHCNIKQAKEKLKQALGKFAQQFDNPLVIIIDELDRCRPDYAVRTLEAIKHFFNIPNIVFVLAIDREQIESAISVLYGKKIENSSAEYLRKFIDQDFYLPKPDSFQYINKLAEEYLRDSIQLFCQDLDNLTNILSLDIIPNSFRGHCRSFARSNNGKYIIRFHNNLNDYRNLTDAMLHVFSKYITAFSFLYGFSLRTQEQVIIFLQMFIKSLDTNKDILIPELAVALVCIRFLNSNLLNRNLSLENLSNPNYIRENFPNLKNKSDYKYMGLIESIPNTKQPHNTIKPIELWSKYLYFCRDSSSLNNLIASSSTYGYDFIYQNQLKKIQSIYNGIYPRMYVDKVKQLNLITKEAN